MKKVYLALMCLAVVAMFTACDGKKTNEPENENQEEKLKPSDLEGKWITNPDMLKGYAFDTVKNCYQFDVWCDGTTIGREYMWTTESAIIMMIKMSQEAELKTFGEYHKKYMYKKVDEPTEEACNAREWEGAECWIETVTYKNSKGEEVKEVQYCWWPEQNMKERHDYYMEKLEQIGVFNHEYEKSSITDKDACLDMNPKDEGGSGDNPSVACWKITISDGKDTQVLYAWNAESSLKTMVEAYKSQGYTVTYVKSSETDPDSCNAKNGE